MALSPMATYAQGYPEKPIRLVNPYAPGGALDTFTRMLARKLHDSLGQPVVVENKPGAGGNIGVEMVAKSPADGYTLVMATSSTHGANPALYGARLPFDAVKDFEMISVTGVWANVLVVNPEVIPSRNLQEFIAYVKARPDKLSFGSSALGGSQHMAGELFKAKVGVDIVHVPYKGGAPAMADLLGGQIHMIFNDLPGALPHIRSGKLRALGLTMARRSEVMPDLVPFAEQGFPDFDLKAWHGVMAPAGTPKAIVDKLNAAVLAAMREPEVRQQLLTFGMEPLGLPVAESEEFMKTELARWAEVVRISGARL
jgi:tripartite-type tricarboxylate transporter receptor subunit TctC